MDNAQVLEYKCPCCNAGLRFQEGSQHLRCDYCDNTFDLDTVINYNEGQPSESLTWDEAPANTWDEQEQANIHAFSCPACGGQILTDATTAATFCPYCNNPTVIPGRLSGTLKPDAVIPFQKTKEDAAAAFLQMCKGKPLLPKMFTQDQHLEQITGIYVPFWLYDCDARFSGSYKATRTHIWSDSRYNYTRTEHFLLRRGGNAGFENIPMDGSTKMDDTFMESIEPFDFSKLEDFDMRYLSGFLADMYDVPSESGEGRIRSRVNHTVEQELQASFLGYSSVVPVSKQLHVNHSKAKYVLLPVWILNTKYNGKMYTFAMNGQTGKMTGSLPASSQRTAAWFAGIFAGVAAFVSLLQLLL